MIKRCFFALFAIFIVTFQPIVPSSSQAMGWEEGSPQKIALHAAVGAAVAAVADGDVLSGASAAALNEALTPIIQKALEDAGLEGSGINLLELTKTALGTAVGGDLGGAISQRADEFNRQLHPTEEDLIRDNAAAYAVELGLCENESECSDTDVDTAEGVLVRQALYQVDEIFSKQFSEDSQARDFLSRVSAKYAESIEGHPADIEAGLDIGVANYGTFQASEADFKDHFKNIEYIYSLEDAYSKVLNDGEIATLKIMNVAHTNLMKRTLIGGVDGISDTLSGIADLAVMVATDPEQLAEIAKLIADDPSLLVDGVVEPFKDRYEAGDIAGAVGYALPAVLEIIAGTKGVGAVVKGGKGTLNGVENVEDVIDILKIKADDGGGVVPNSTVKPAPVNGDKLVPPSSNPGTAQSRVNVAKVTDDNGNVRGFDYALGKHGKNATTGSNKSKFSISDSEVKILLQNKDVVKSPVYNVRNPVTGEIDPNKFGRQVDVGKNIGTTLVDGKTVKTSTITIITNRKGNLINTFPGQF